MIDIIKIDTTRLILLLLSSAGLACAQSTGAITGAVRDSSGAMMSGASVSAVQQQTNERFEANTDPGGRFSFPRLPVGDYRVEATHQGFRRFFAPRVAMLSFSAAVIGIGLLLSEVPADGAGV